MPTIAERGERYFEGIDEGHIQDDAHVPDIAHDVQDPERDTTAEPMDTEGSFFTHSETGGFDPEDGSGGSPLRHRRVRFSLPSQHRTEGDSRGGVGGQPEVR